MEDFKYNSLVHSLSVPSFSQIRLLLLLPRCTLGYVEDRQQIRCKMKTVSLVYYPEYTALSYTWGDPRRTSLLIIDDKISHITKSVESALLHLQHETDIVIL
jgi:hypothetical protein